MGANVCYHHSNCLDRPAVATCNACGKSLCQECASKFRSQKTGKALCVDCYNAQLKRDAQSYSVYAKQHKKKSIVMIVCCSIFGAIPILFGILALLAALFTWDAANLVTGLVCILFGLWAGSAVTSIKKVFNIASKISSIAGWFWPLTIVLFIVGLIIGVLISPILFAIELINHIKDTKRFNRFAYLNEKLIAANNEFLLKARSMKSGSMDSERTIALKNEIAQLNKKLEQAKAQADSSTSKVDLAQIQALIDAKMREEKAEREAMAAEFKKQLDENAKEDAAARQEYAELEEYFNRKFETISQA